MTIVLHPYLYLPHRRSSPRARYLQHQVVARAMHLAREVLPWRQSLERRVAQTITASQFGCSRVERHSCLQLGQGWGVEHWQGHCLTGRCPAAATLFPIYRHFRGTGQPLSIGLLLSSQTLLPLQLSLDCLWCWW